MSNKAPIRFRYGGDRWLLLLMGLVYTAALLLLWLSALALIWKAILFLGLCAATFLYWKYDKQGAAQIDTYGRVTFTDDGIKRSGLITGDTWITPWWITFYVRLEEGRPDRPHWAQLRHAFLISKANNDKDEFRRLLVALKHEQWQSKDQAIT